MSLIDSGLFSNDGDQADTKGKSGSPFLGQGSEQKLRFVKKYAFQDLVGECGRDFQVRTYLSPGPSEQPVEHTQDANYRVEVRIEIRQEMDTNREFFQECTQAVQLVSAKVPVVDILAAPQLPVGRDHDQDIGPFVLRRDKIRKKSRIILDVFQHVHQQDKADVGLVDGRVFWIT